MTGRHTKRNPWGFVVRRGPLVCAALGCALLAGSASPALSANEVGLSTDGSFEASKVISRVNLIDGQDKQVDSRTFHVTVSQTRQLRDRQEITVNWSGAQPTGGIVGDHNSASAAQQEYPVMLVECRGVDDPTDTAAAQVSPETCFTHTPAERFQADLAAPFPAFRLDRYDTPAERKISVGQPNPLPAACANQATGVQHWIPFIAADGTTYAGGSLGCAGLPPEAVNVEQQLQPSNTAYGVTALDGTGEEKFVVATAETNASLGCSVEVNCTLEIIPIEGISCDPSALGLPEEDRPTKDEYQQALDTCTQTGHYLPGEINPGGQNQQDKAVSGVLWWSASNWRNRVPVPMDFAPPSNICSVKSSGTPAYVYGSELMVQATQQWSPAFCLDSTRFPLQHVQTGEPQAKNLLNSGSIEAAFQAGPPLTPFTRPVVQAPAAVSGFAIAFSVDDDTGRAVHTLKLTPRLLAKLLSQSYPTNAGVRTTYPALSHNPYDLPSDPEFRALNPHMPTLGYDREPASTLFFLSSESDIVSAVTAYINADPEARAFLDGKPDPWGMTVNPNYKGIALPVQSWPQLDSFTYQPNGNDCFATSPVPWMEQVAAPVSTLATLTLNMQFSLANSQIKCANSGQINQKLTSLGRQNPGTRFLLGVTSLGAAARFQLDTAELQTTGPAPSNDQFTSANGRTFVKATDESLTAGAKLLSPSADKGTWLLPYGDFHASPSASSAYPGSMLISLDVPTRGLSAQDAQRYSELMTFVAGSGQTPGTGNGQLPDGYLPLNASDGLGAQVAYTLAAAKAVRAQGGAIPSLDGREAPQASPSPTSAAVITPPAPAVGGTTSGGTTGSTTIGSGSSRPTTAPHSSAPTVAPRTTNPPATIVPAAATGRTPDLGVGASGLILPLLLALLGALGVLALTVLNMPAGKPSA